MHIVLRITSGRNLGARDELPDSEETFNASQMNTNLQKMFLIDAAAADGSELDICVYDEKNNLRNP